MLVSNGIDHPFALCRQTRRRISSATNAPLSYALSARSSPILEFLFFHKAIRAELELLRQDALAMERGCEKDLLVLWNRFQFLRIVYIQHSNAEDEIIFPALDSHVKNVAWTYSLEHKEENDLFDKMSELLNRALKDKENTSIELRRELICCVEAIQTTLCQHMSKEEEQIFPLLMEHFSIEDQATIVWQFLCSIPVNLMEQFLPWLASSLSPDDRQEMMSCLHKIVPKEELLRQVIFSWLNGGRFSAPLEGSVRETSDEVTPCTRDLHPCVLIAEAKPIEGLAMLQVDEVSSKSQGQCEDLSFYTPCDDSHELAESVNGGATSCSDLPINELLHWHEAIRKELKEFADEAKRIQLSACDLPSNLLSFSKRLQFLAEVCIFHSAAEDKVLFPAVGRKTKHGLSYISEHELEEQQFDDVRRLLQGICDSGAGGLTASEIYDKLCNHTNLIVDTVQQHLLDEEMKVLPLAREHCSIEEQRVLLYQSLRVMPLKLLERVLPWLVGILSEEEAKSMLQNMRLAAPVSDTALVTLFCGWACKGHTQNVLESTKFRCISPNSKDGCPIKMMNSMETSCYCELASFDLPSEEVDACVTIPEERACKRLKNSGTKQGEDLSNIEAIQSNCSNQPCCVPGLGVSSSSLGFGAGSTARSLQGPPSSGYLGSGLFGWGNAVGSSGSGVDPKPIDTIFQFHKAIRKDLEHLDAESAKLVDCSDEFLRQFTGRFRLLWGLYRAHSNAEDEIVFPALESKEALHNVSLSYTIDHKQEEKLFNDISSVLAELSQLQGRIQGQDPTRASEGQGHLENSGATSLKVKDNFCQKHELATKLQGMCKTIHISLDQHVSREELELWPLFDAHFTVEEQDKIIGQIIGTTGAEVLQTMLPWVTTALTEDEQNSMMDSWRQATRNTMFDEWLRAWWKGSPAVSICSSASKIQDLPGSGTPEYLKVVADYLSKGVSVNDNLEKEKVNSSGSSDVDSADGKGLVCHASFSQGGKFKELEEEGVCDSKVTTREITSMEGSHIQSQVEDGTGKFKPGWQNIFRMNQKELESAIRKVSSDTSLDPRQKAYLMQNLLTSRWIVAQQQVHTLSGRGSSNEVDIPGRCPSYHDSDKGIYGCEHYKRNCKVQAACCGLLFTCRFCHDKVSDHSMDRQATKEMMCMKCLEVQPVGKFCATPSCNRFSMARYYCNICKLFDDDIRDIYHCPSCNLCRVGKGLGVDYFHCMTCNACMSMSLKVHKCREKGLESNCPICHDFLFTSKAPVKALSCGHFMHSACFQAYTCCHYTCPICSKSLGDMAVYFGMLDALLASEQLPEEYRDRWQDVLCHDCQQKGRAPFHWLYHKCRICGSYNTRAI
eukprot:c29174_g1_i3 orf=1038-5078(-)